MFYYSLLIICLIYRCFEMIKRVAPVTDGGAPFCEVRESSCKIDKNKTIFPINYINFTSSMFLLNN